jgi:hypothetical protein
MLKTRKRDFSSLTATPFLFTGGPTMLSTQPEVQEVEELPPLPPLQLPDLLPPTTLTQKVEQLETAPPLRGIAEPPALAHADDFTIAAEDQVEEVTEAVRRQVSRLADTKLKSRKSRKISPRRLIDLQLDLKNLDHAVCGPPETVRSCATSSAGP